MGKVIPMDGKKAPEGFSLVLKFIDQSTSFTYGFECGLIWQQLKDGKEITRYMVNAENREQIDQIAQAIGKQAYFDEVAVGWLYVTIA